MRTRREREGEESKRAAWGDFNFAMEVLVVGVEGSVP
jgi:hypothetical protein